MDASGLKANFVNGLRVTDEATIAIVKKTLDEVVNKDVCDTLASVKAQPEGPAGRQRARLPEAARSTTTATRATSATWAR